MIKKKYFSRQTIRNILLKSHTSNTYIKQKDYTPETLYIIADERWIHTQNNNHNKVMEKSVVIFEFINNHKLYNKQVFPSINNSYLEDSINYIYNSYNSYKIKTIFVMRDGTKWISKLKYEYKHS